MKLRHLQFRADAKALAFAFSDSRFFISPSLDPRSLWSFVEPPPGFDLVRVPWAKHLEWAQRMFHTKGPLASLRQCARELLETSGQWMSLRSVAGAHEGISDARIRALAHDLWIARKLQSNDDWTDWLSALELLDTQPGDEILRWRWMSLALPASLFIGAGTPPGSIPPRAVRLLDRSIAPTGQVALLHAHLGAMSSFEALWSKLGMRIISTRELDSRLRDEENPLGKGNGASWIECLRQAFIVRDVLLRHAGHSFSLGRCSLCDLPGDLRNVVWHFANDPRAMITSIRDLQPKLWEGERREECFLQRALEHAGREEGQYEVLLTQYLRAKVLLFRHIVANPDEPGLAAFVQTSGKSKSYQVYPTSAELEAEVTREIGLDIRCGELRTNLRNWLDNYIGKAPLESSSIESGWVLHFQRTSGATADPARKIGTIRAASRKRRLDATDLAKAIRINPHILQHLRGLDVAALEREGPLWGFVRYLKMVRDVSKDAAAVCPGLSPLRLTLHVGEDFDHLLSGLRAVHEPFAWRLMERGDRLGHAIALGIDPLQWVKWTSQREPGYKMRPWDRLLDIGWIQYAFRVLRRGADESQFGRLSNEAMNLLRKLNWTQGLDGALLSQSNAMDIAESLWLNLGLASPDADPRLRILHDRVPDSMLLKLYPAEPSKDLRLLEALREPLATLVAKSGVAIEVNPTSNMIVAGLPGMLEQPFFQLLSTERDCRHALALAISSDDPLNLATCLADEFAYAWAGMVAGRDLPANYARTWLEEAASTSMRMRFTLPNSR